MSKEINWRGSSLKDLRDFPPDARKTSLSSKLVIVKLSKSIKGEKMKDDIDVASRHITPAGGNVFAELGFSDEDAQVLHADSQSKIAQTLALKEQLMTEISNWIAQQNLRQIEAARVLQVSRPRVSDVVNKKTDKFTLDALILMLSLTGKQVRLVIE